MKPNLFFASPLKKITLSILFSIYTLSVISQCTNTITHLNGSQVVNGISVTVTRSGKFGAYNLCNNTFAYGAGYDTYQTYTSGNGKYRFDFSPPIGAAMLSIHYLTNTSSGLEEVIMLKNDVHYSLELPLESSLCGTIPQPISDGNLRACAGCSASAVDGLMINGPSISSITLIDTVHAGYPYGVFFSIAFCKTNELGIKNNYANNIRLDLYPNPASEVVVLETEESSEISILNNVGQLIQDLGLVMENKVTLSTSAFSTGIYFVQIKNKQGLVHQKKLLIER